MLILEQTKLLFNIQGFLIFGISLPRTVYYLASWGVLCLFFGVGMQECHATAAKNWSMSVSRSQDDARPLRSTVTERSASEPSQSVLSEPITVAHSGEVGSNRTAVGSESFDRLTGGLGPDYSARMELNRPSIKLDDPFNPEAVRRAIRDASEFLKARQLPDGSWPMYQSQGDTTALCTLALINSADNMNDEAIQRGVNYLLTVPREERTKNYFLSLRIMVLATVDPQGEKYRRELSTDVSHLLDNQHTEGVFRGGWSYDLYRNPGSPDASNSQFAVLALHEASRVGVKIPKLNWELARDYWSKVRDPRSGGFVYRAVGQGGVLGSMTTAGISSWIIIEENLTLEENNYQNEYAECCGGSAEMDVVEQAIQWLARNYSVRVNPVQGGRGNYNQLYYLYGLERAGRLSGRRFFGPHDWYRDGANELIRRQTSKYWVSRGHGEDVQHIGTALALLFLAKGKQPVAIGKYQYRNDRQWDTHAKGVHYLTGRLEKQWQQKLNWQTVAGMEATVDDLLETPVLFISGRQPIELSALQKENLKKYLDNGGFMFVENCQGEGCGESGFDRSFRQLMAELFPDSELEPLESSHPIWNAHYPLLPNSERPLLGLRACCRTSVIYCPANLSCYWELDRESIKEVANPKLWRRIEACSQLGVNVVTYATGRMLKDKGETPKLAEDSTALLNHRALEFPKLLHTGGADDAPNAVRILMKKLQSEGMRIKLEKNLISINDDALFDFPLVFMHGRSDFRLSEIERKQLQLYLERGGILFADSICSTPTFTNAFRSEIQKVTGQKLNPIADTHEIWSEAFGGRIEQVTIRTRDSRATGGFQSSVRRPLLEGIEIDGRLAVIFSPLDISCALENATFSQCDGHIHEDAVRMGRKIIFYSLLGDRSIKTE